MSKINYIILAVIALFLSFCTKETQEPDLNADFNFSYEGTCSSPTLEVHFENLSKNTTSYLWDFGDGTSSTEITPTKVYDKAGTYTVTLTAYASEKNISVSKEITISRNSDGKGPIIELSFAHGESSGLQITFIITLINASSYKIDFGDGSSWVTGTIDSDSPFELMHTYPGPARYQVILFAYGNEGASCFSTAVQF